MAEVEIRFKRSPMHHSQFAGRAKVGSSLKEVFAVLGEGIFKAIQKHTRVYVSNPVREASVYSPRKWNYKLREGDVVTLVAVPGELITIIIAVIIAVAIAIALQPDIPKAAPGRHGNLYTLAGGNDADAYSPVPVVCGTYRAPVKFIAQPAGRVSLHGTSSEADEAGVAVEENPNRTEGGIDECGPGDGGYLYQTGVYKSKHFKDITETDRGDADTDFLRILGTFGPGPIELRDIRIGDVSIEDIAAEFQIYLGDGIPPDKMEFYTGTKRVEDINRALDGTDDPNEDWVEFTTLNDPVEARFDIGFTQGLSKTSSKSGRNYAASVRFDYQWRPVGGEWTPLRARRVRKYSVTPFFISIGIAFPTGGLSQGASVRIRRIGTAGSGRRYRDSSATLLVRFVSSRALDVGTPNSMPANYSLFSAKIKADARTSGNLPTVSAKVSRKVLDYSAYNQDTDSGEVLTASSNPAWIYLDALFGDRVNGVATPRVRRAEVDWEAFKAWAEFCDETLDSTMVAGIPVNNKIGEFNTIIESSATLEKTLRNIAAAGYAAPRMRGVLHSIFWEATARAPVGLLTEATISKLTVERRWPEEVHGYRVSYADPKNDYKSNQVIAYADGYADVDIAADPDATPPVTAKLGATIIKDLDGEKLGCASRASAWRYGRYKIADESLHQEGYQCDVGPDSLYFETGDVLNLAHDVLQIGQLSGRVEREGFLLTSVPLEAVDGQGLPTSHPHLLIIDQPVPDGLFDASHRSRQFSLETATGLHEAEVFSAHNVSIFSVALAGSIDHPERALVTFGLPDITFAGYEYSIGGTRSASGDYTGAVTPVVVHSIAPRKDNSARLTLRDYRGAELRASWIGAVPDRNPVFDDNQVIAANVPPTPLISHMLPGPIKPGSDVSNIFVFFEDVDIGADISELVLQWRLDGDTAWQGGAQPIAHIPTLIDVQAGAKYHVRAAYRNRGGFQSPWGEATSINNAKRDVVIGGPPPPVEGLEIEGRGNSTEFYGRGLIIVWRDPARVTDEGLTDPGFDGYNVKVLHGDRELVNQKVYQPRFDYSPDFTPEDDGPFRELTFEVTRQDVTRGASAVKTLTVTNPRPAAPTIVVEENEGIGLVVRSSGQGEPDFKEVLVWADVAENNAAAGITDLTHQPLKVRSSSSPIELPYEVVGYTPGLDRTFIVQAAVADSFGGDDNEWNASPVTRRRTTSLGQFDRGGRLPRDVGWNPLLIIGRTSNSTVISGQNCIIFDSVVGDFHTTGIGINSPANSLVTLEEGATYSVDAFTQGFNTVDSTVTFSLRSPSLNFVQQLGVYHRTGGGIDSAAGGHSFFTWLTVPSSTPAITFFSTPFYFCSNYGGTSHIWRIRIMRHSD